MLEYLLDGRLSHVTDEVLAKLPTLIIASRYKEGVIIKDDARGGRLLFWGNVTRLLAVDGLEYSPDGNPIRSGVRHAARYIVTGV